MTRSSNLTLRHASKSAPAFKAKPVALACALAVLTAGAAYAQQTTDSLGTVTVTGIRAGIESAIALKRNADSIVEAVSAEDIGKLPDASIADSIARLPGLAAQRVDGRASAISIRGLGPDFAGAVLNGREVVSSGDGRAAEYDQFPSELIHQVLVYKTPDAALIGQGLSGTVDIRPVMPLDSRGRQVSVSLRGEQNSLGQLSPQGGANMGNRVSASYVNQFADNTVGLALGFAHLDSPGQSKKYEAWKYGDYVGQWGAGATGVPAAGGAKALFAQGMEASVTSSKQVRDGLMAVLELRPNKDVHSVVDLYYSKFTQDRVSNFWAADIGLWSGGGQFSNVGTTNVNGNAIIDSGTVAGGRNLVYEKNWQRSDDISSLGWKNEIKLGNKWTGVTDLGFSRANRKETYIQSVAKGQAGGPMSFSGLGSTGNQAWSTTENLASASNVQLTNDPNWAEMRTPSYQDDIKTLRLSAKRDLEVGIFSGLEAGLNYAQRDKDVQSNAYSLALASNNVAIPASALRGPVNINVGGANVNTVSWDIPSMMNLYTQAAKDPWSALSNTFGVHEKVTTAFAKLNLDTALGAVPLRGNVGVQAVHTEQSSTGMQWNDGGTPGAPGSGALIAVSGGADYNDYLPSLNLVANLNPELIARFGLAKAMARPRMDDMRAGADQPKLTAVAPGSTIGQWSAGAGGKPDLQPWRAQSVDFSLEKYFGKSSYVAGAAFYKKLDSFIYRQETVRDFSMFKNYSNLTPGCVPSNPGCNPNLGTVTTQTNGQGGEVWGLEISASLEGALLSPALKGFGVIVSESGTNNSLPNDKNGNKIYLDGFSGNVNSLTLYYEDQGFSSRISRRSRSAFTATTRSVLLNTESNTQIDAETQVDMQVGYAFNSGTYKGLSLLLQVNNLTDAPAVQTRGPEVGGNALGLLPWKTENFGRSMMFGATYKF